MSSYQVTVLVELTVLFKLVKSKVAIFPPSSHAVIGPAAFAVGVSSMLIIKGVGSTVPEQPVFSVIPIKVKVRLPVTKLGTESVAVLIS